MKPHHSFTRIIALFSSLMLATLLSGVASAHCDSMSGPVVKDAQKALSEKKVDVWLKTCSEQINPKRSISQF